MQRIVAIQVRNGVAAGLWALGALCVPTEPRQPELWATMIEALRARTEVSADPAIRRSGDLNTSTTPAVTQQAPVRIQHSEQISRVSEPAAPSNEVAAEQQASQLPEADSSDANDAHTRLIVISIPDRQLALLEDGEVVKVYPIAVGARHSPSPEGEYTVINHSVNPTYRHREIKIDPGKDNPLGTRWMGLSLKGYGIHGTNVQSSIGKALSHGCFRMKKKDVEELYELVQVGDAVSVRGKRDELTAKLFTVPAPDASANKQASSLVAAANTTETVVASVAIAGASSGQ